MDSERIRWMVQLNIAAPPGATQKDIEKFIREALSLYPGRDDKMLGGVEVKSVRFY